MVLKLIALLAIGVAGWALGRMRPKVELIALVLTVFAALMAHSGMQFAFVDGRLDRALGDPRTGAFEGVVVLIAAGEAAGLWLPVLLVPWAPFAARLWGGLYALAAAAMAAVFHYFPFDLVVFNDELIARDGPPYLLAVFACLPIAGAGYLFGWANSHRDDPDVDGDDLSGSLSV